MPSVKCSVDDCRHWGPGGVCRADAISVNRARSARTEFADEPGSAPGREQAPGETRQTAPDDFRGTCCETMRRRREGPGEAEEGRRGSRGGRCRP